MKHRIFFLLTFALLAGFTPARAQNPWPKDIPTSNGGKITIYEPQPESLSGNKLTGRAAVSFRKTDTEEPVFGAMFFTATLLTDKSSRMAELESLTVTNAKFSGVADQAEVDTLATLIQKDAPKWNLNMSIDDLVASIKQENGTASGDDFNNAAPKIIYANKPTSLVVLDGAPQILNDKNLGADKVANSPNLIFKEGKLWNLYVGGTWYKSTSVTGGWKPNTSLSAKVKSVNEQVKKQEDENNNGKAPAAAPKLTDIIVATEPTELLQTDGEPVYQTVAGTSLLYVSNSPNEIFKEINSQKTYILIAGRWYSSTDMKGPWEYIASDKLPEDFAKIPEGSDKDGVLSNVAGTDAAEEAKIDAEIPQTAKVDRKTATVDVQYDGAPQFNPIEGTSLQLAENANLTVMIDASGSYFALDNGVWFIANGPNGPWSVANDRPKNIDDIPANNAAYNSKYVYIYDQTPDYVYTGYTSGYLGSYLYGPTIVYGTGYHYRPWFRTMYYPRPVTWGFGFIYSPWNGWNMNWGYNFGFLYVGFNYGGRFGYGGGWFGPPMYHPPYRRPYWSGGYYGRSTAHRPYYGGGNRPGGGRPVSQTGRPIGARPGSGWTSNNNIYNNHRGVITRDISRTRIVNRPGTIDRPNRTRPISNGNNNRLPANNNANRRPANTNNRLPGNNGTRPPMNNTNRPAISDNNVLTDREGNVYRRDAQNNNWQTRDNRARDWKPLTDDRNNRVPDLNRQQQSRERGQTRQNNFNRDVPVITRPAPAPRPAVNNPSPAQRPVISRPAPAPRPAVNNPPAQRPVISRPAPAQRPAMNSRPASPQGGGGRGNTNVHGGRPSR